MEVIDARVLERPRKSDVGAEGVLDAEVPSLDTAGLDEDMPMGDCMLVAGRGRD